MRNAIVTGFILILSIVSQQQTLDVNPVDSVSGASIKETTQQNPNYVDGVASSTTLVVESGSLIDTFASATLPADSSPIDSVAGSSKTGSRLYGDDDDYDDDDEEDHDEHEDHEDEDDEEDDD
jgi:phosphopantothenoylcysteine synthetase/decarboxylase